MAQAQHFATADRIGTGLFLDASGPAARVGIWKNRDWLAYREETGSSLETLFAATTAGLAEAKLGLAQVRSILYVEGPGSVLGLRVAAMAVRAWQVDEAARAETAEARAIWSCGSLHLAAALALAGGNKAPFTLCTAARQGSWQVLVVGGHGPTKLSASTIREIDEAEVSALTGVVWHLPGRKMFGGLPAQAATLAVSLREHPEVLVWPELWRAVAEPVPFTGAPVEYKKWAGGAKPA